MIFQHTWQQVLDGTKTQTRRPVRLDEVGLAYLEPAPPHIVAVVRRPPNSAQWDTFDGRPYEPKPGTTNQYQPIPYRFRLGQEHAVQPGRGKSGVGRIRITAIRRQDVREISDEDVKAEGFASKISFLETWVGMHDSNASFCEVAPETYTQWRGRKDKWFHGTERDVLEYLNTRPDEWYQAWALTFEVVK